MQVIKLNKADLTAIEGADSPLGMFWEILDPKIELPEGEKVSVGEMCVSTEFNKWLIDTQQASTGSMLVFINSGPGTYDGNNANLEPKVRIFLEENAELSQPQQPTGDIKFTISESAVERFIENKKQPDLQGLIVELLYAAANYRTIKTQHVFVDLWPDFASQSFEFLIQRTEVAKKGAIRCLNGSIIFHSEDSGDGRYSIHT